MDPAPVLPSPPLVRRAYDAGAEDLAARLPDVAFEAPLDLAVVDAFVQAVVAGPQPRVLDAGCGGGRMSRYLTDRGCRVEGVDLSPGMVATARRDHPDLPFAVASLSALPYAEAAFAGVLLWYSVIHTPPDGLARILTEAGRVLRPGGHVLLGFQSGEGVRDVPWAHDRGFPLDRYLHTADQVAAHAGAAGLHEVARLVRRRREHERDDQAFLLLRSDAASARP